MHRNKDVNRVVCSRSDATRFNPADTVFASIEQQARAKVEIGSRLPILAAARRSSCLAGESAKQMIAQKKCKAQGLAI